MEHRVGGAARGHDHDHGVLEGRARHDVPGLEVHFEQLVHGFAGCEALVGLLCRVRGGAAGVGKRHAQRLDSGGHGVGCVHAAARARARAGLLDDDLPLLLSDLAVLVLAVGLERRDNVEDGAVNLRRRPRTDRTAVHHDGGAVEAGHGHHSAWHVLVAAGERDVAIIPLSAHDGLDGVGDDVTRLKRVGHAVCAHGDAVGHSDGVEAVPDHARFRDALLHLASEVKQMHVARVALIPHARNTDLRLVEILGLEAGSVEHRLGRALALVLRELLAVLVHLHGVLGSSVARRKSHRSAPMQLRLSGPKAKRGADERLHGMKRCQRHQARSQDVSLGGAGSSSRHSLRNNA
mmetsp:Transcript_35695/g.84727  ORF Transcript_35695/g.84727 Transcript_35695/m.84727 type:complete len:349 (-) Transcript_35695:48-1094(-)